MRGMETAQRERRWLVWQQAFLPNAKKKPSYEAFIGGTRKPSKPKTPEQLLDVALQWDAALNASRRHPHKPQT